MRKTFNIVRVALGALLCIIILAIVIPDVFIKDKEVVTTTTNAVSNNASYKPIKDYKNKDLVAFGVVSNFYKEDIDVADVVVIGSSAVYKFLCPAKLYDEQKITMINYATPALDIRATTGLIQEAIDRQHPKLIVLETRRFIERFQAYDKGNTPTQKELDYKEYLIKKVVDSMPPSKNRTEVIEDTVPSILGLDAAVWEVENFYPGYKASDYSNEQLKKIIEDNYVAADAKYSGIKTEEYRGEKYKGIAGSTDITQNKEVDFSDYNEIKDISGDALQNLMDIIKKAEDCGTEVMFLSTPYCATEKDVAYENGMGEYIEGSGFKYLNCNKVYDEIGIDFSCDFYDRKHTNVSGIAKVTSYFGKYIVREYGLSETALSETQKQEWQKAADLWNKECYIPMMEKLKKSN